ncbi:MAG: O-antigen ligase family protein [Clostridia bacterium]|nr:O-antigen ligase family protein [Clostridia bacterium]
MAIPLSYLVTTLWAVDSSTALYGFIKLLPVALFGMAVAPMKKEERAEITDVIPYSAVAMGVLSYGLSLIPALSDFFLVADRLGGFFQYPNTFACFCLTGIPVLLLKEKLTYKSWLLSALLVGIILLTGSRTVFILLVLVAVIIFMKIGKKYRKGILCLFGGAVAVSLIVVLLTDSVQTVGRFLTISAESSTLLGRLLYYKDALPVILKNPFGLGYYGYYFSQGSFQSGVYSVAFIHNELLQLLLDIGWIPTALIVYVFIKSLTSKKNGMTERMILFIILSHSMLDFDLQFVCMFFVLILNLDFDTVSVARVKFSTAVLATVLGALTLISVYFGAVNVLYLTGQYEAVEKIYGKDTQSQIFLMTEEKDYDRINSYAESVLSRNEYVSIAYSAKANYSFKNGDMKSFMDYKEKAIDTAAYSIDEYNSYCEKLITGINLYLRAGDRESASYCAGKLTEVARMLEELRENTDALAWKIKDKPELELKEEISEYIKEITQ